MLVVAVVPGEGRTRKLVKILMNVRLQFQRAHLEARVGVLCGVDLLLLPGGEFDRGLEARGLVGVADSEEFVMAAGVLPDVPPEARLNDGRCPKPGHGQRARKKVRGTDLKVSDGCVLQ